MTLTTPSATPPGPPGSVTTPDAPAAGPATRSVPPRVRAALAVLAAAVAFAPSLAGLLADLRYGAPTGDLVVVPVVAALMLDAVVRSRPTAWNGRLGHGDLVVAGVLVAAAAALVLVPDGRTTNGRWLTRLDLLAQPLALAAFAVLLLGLRVMALGVVPLGFGLLVWPWPVTWLNIHAVAPLTTATYTATGHLGEWTGLAERVVGSAENTLRLGSGDGVFEVVVAPACSGITGLAAYLVVAGAVLALSAGRWRGRAAWVACGLVAVWAANVVRILALAAAGRLWGARVALDLLHPVAGLVLDAAVVAVLVAVMHRFGLRWVPVARAGRPGDANVVHGAFAAPLGPPSTRSVAVRVVLVALLAGALLVAELRTSAPAGGVATTVPVRSVQLSDVVTAGADARFLGEEAWSQAYFGAGSRWDRYSVTAATGGTVWVDSLSVDDDDALRAHDVLGCYGFHGALVTDGGTVRVDDRFVARLLVVRQPTGEQWQSLYWEWPLRTTEGLRYERVTLFVGGAPGPAPGGAPAGDAAARPGGAPDPAMTRTLVTTAGSLARAVLAADSGDAAR
jgi:exosortase/archaeosortase family protein